MSGKSLKSALIRKRFIIPAGTPVADIKTVLCKNFHCEESPLVTLRRAWHDTFDWRAFGAGAVIETEAAAGVSVMNWRDLESGELLDSIAIRRPIRFARDIPPGRLRERAEPLLEMRALLPLVHTGGKVQSLNVLNKDDKTVVHLALEDMQLSATGKSAKNRLPITLSVEPVRGYGEPFRQVLSFIEQQLALQPDTQNATLRVFETAGLLPGGYTSRLNLQLTPEMRSDAAARTILLRLFETMRANEEGMKADRDSEFLHEYRVAVRRTRSLLGQSKEVLPKPKLDKFRREFSWLGEISSPTRDLDVYLLDFDKFKNSLPLPLKEDINPFHDFLERHQKIAHQRLAAQMESSRYRKLAGDWDAFLKSPLPAHSSLAHALRPAIETATERIWHMYRRVIKEGEAIQPHSPPEELHELRKSCKKLRYLMEFFSSLYPQNLIRQLIAALKSLQDQLGEYQDLHVQLATLATLRAQMIVEAIASERMLVAFELILQTIDQRQKEVRALFKTRFADFAEAKNRDSFAELFKPQARS